MTISFLLDGSLWISHENGLVAKFDFDDFLLDIVGETDGGISAAQWSPDGELVIIVSADLTASDSLQLLTAEMDPISTQSAVSGEKGEEVPVNVGWGSRETQFMGSAGKASREVVIENATSLSSRDRLSVDLCWRGDSELFCTSVPFTSGRRTRIYSREGVHLVTTTTDASFLGPISWRSSSLLSVSFKIQLNKNISKKTTVAFNYRFICFVTSQSSS